ncbi:MAG: hypothetical protein LQ340_007789 [Diploschistes diacapsis]|nr:MAG: hypothetical protein LQ340_007789 [Diploschistes diacapsis]
MEELARRNHTPTLETPDLTSYGNIMRPGVAIECISGSDLLGTTLGVRVMSHDGDRKCITVAAHGCPDLNDIYQPRVSGGRKIGTVIKHLGDTDIGLMQLENHIVHENEVFGNEYQATGFRLREITSQSDEPEFIELNSPYDGYMMGTVARIEYRRIAEEGLHEEIGEKYTWVTILWSPMHTPSGVLVSPTNGTCGTPITLLDGAGLVSFFRFHDYENKMSISIAASNLRSFGYDLA